MPENVVSTTTLAAPARPDTPKTHGSLDADIIIKNAPDPVLVSLLRTVVSRSIRAPSWSKIALTKEPSS